MRRKAAWVEKDLGEKFPKPPSSSPLADCQLRGCYCGVSLLKAHSGPCSQYLRRFRLLAIVLVR